ncbi:MAG TPA: hypothetical protein VLX09_10045 [Stellaceae bacterium]|nr:hypothetical protein [Stellaceae bacterium]
MRRSLVKLGVLLGVTTLSACGGAPSPPPLLSLDGRSCAAEPDLARALLLTLEPVKPVAVVLGANTACWEPVGGPKAIYAAFQLPEASHEYLITGESAPAGLGLFSPRLVVLDAAGQPLREIPRDSFQFHSALLSAGVRAHQGERYLIVASDPSAIGKSESRIASSSSVSTTCVRTGCINIYAGHEATTTLVYAYNGSITVTARPLPSN